MKSTSTTGKIKPEQFYSLGEIVREHLIPGVETIAQASRLVQRDAIGPKILRARQLPRGTNGVQYKVKGANIITYLKKI